LTIPNITETIRDGALGLTSGNTDNVFVVIGPCTRVQPAAGVVSPPIVLSSVSDARAALGYGLLAEAVAHQLAVAGGTVIAIPAAQTAGSIGAVTAGGTNTSPRMLATATTPADTYNMLVSISQGSPTGGSSILPAFQYSLDGGSSLGGTINLQPPTGMTQAGMVAPVAAGVPGTSPSLTVSGAVASSVTALSSIVVKVTTSGVLSAAAVELSYDGGAFGSSTPLTGSPIALTGNGLGLSLSFPAGTYAINETYTFSTGTVYVIKENDAPYASATSTGVTLSFPFGPYVKGDSWTCATVGPTVTSTDLNTQLNGIIANPALAFSGVIAHCNPVDAGTTSGKNVAILAAGMDTALTTEQAQFQYAFGLVAGVNQPESVSGAAPNDYVAALQNALYLRTSVTGGQATITSALTGRQYACNTALPYAARLAAIAVEQHPGAVATGSLPSVASISTSVTNATAFDNARVVALRQLVGRQGYFVVRGDTLAPSGSDYNEIQRRRVMDKACGLAYAAALPVLNGKLLVNANGTLTDGQASGIEAAMNAYLIPGLLTPGHAVAVSVQVSRTANVASSGTVPITIRVRPFAYAEFIAIDIGFQVVG
jgi:hypothetical protein